jgi:hypothetical protein
VRKSPSPQHSDMSGASVDRKWAAQACIDVNDPLRHLVQRKRMSAFRVIAEVTAGSVKRRS